HGMEKPARRVFGAALRACPSAPAGVTPCVARYSPRFSAPRVRVQNADVFADARKRVGEWMEAQGCPMRAAGTGVRGVGGVYIRRLTIKIENHVCFICIDDGLQVRLRLPDAVAHCLVASSSLQTRFAFLVNVDVNVIRVQCPPASSFARTFAASSS
ncbi:hypothetical protein BJ912DRAFT_968384, partial [Pholiota molesta]